MWNSEKQIYMSSISILCSVIKIVGTLSIVNMFFFKPHSIIHEEEKEYKEKYKNTTKKIGIQRLFYNKSTFM